MLWVLGGLVGATGLVLLARLGELGLAAPEATICLMRGATGLPCPGCGITRSLAAVASGSFEAAFTAHPLGPILVAEALGFWLWIGAGLARDGFPSGRESRWLETLLLGHATALAAIWVGRAASGSLPW